MQVKKLAALPLALALSAGTAGMVSVPASQAATVPATALPATALPATALPATALPGTAMTATAMMHHTVTKTGKFVKFVSMNSFRISVGMKTYLVKTDAMTHVWSDNMKFKLSRLKKGDTVRAAAGKKVEYPCAFGRRRLQDAPQDPLGFLARVTGFLPAGGRHDRVPPDISRQFPPLGFFRRHEARCHIGDPLDRLLVEIMMPGVTDVDEDGVVLGGPAVPRAATVVVRPDDFVQEAVTAENLVEEDLAVVGLPVVDMEIERAVFAEEAAGLFQPGPDESGVVHEPVGV